MAAAAATGPTLQNVTDNQKRWLVFGITLNKVLVSQIRSFVGQEVQKEYDNLKKSHSIHTQSTSGRLKHWPTFLKYENINGNDVSPRMPGGRFDYSKFNCQVTSDVDFAKLYVENHMAKFKAFDEHCDASAVLALLDKVPVFSMAVHSAAGDVRQARNAWAHCFFSDWDPLSFSLRFSKMEKLVKSLGLPSADEMYLVNELKDWETKGAMLCMNATIDPDLVKTVQQVLSVLKIEIDKMAFEEEVNKKNVEKALLDSQLFLEGLKDRISMVEHKQEVIKQEQEVIKQDQSSLCDKVHTTQDQISELKSEQEDVQQRVAHQISDVQRRATYLEDQQKSKRPQINHEIANCESDIAFLAARHDAATRQWLLKDFDNWLSDPGDSRAYVLLGDPGVGKSVMAGVLAQRSRKAGYFGAAYFCRHNDSTRNDPRYLLGTIASQLCECNSQYNSITGGEGGIRKLLGNSNLGVQELFTKLLQEPFYICHSTQRKLIVVDALNETQYESREDFLDLIMNRFPLLPNWLVFFITSRSQNTVQLSLKRYNPCVRICVGNVEHDKFYQQHQEDIKLFLGNNVDFSRLPFLLDDVVKKCNGSFLYAFYVAKDLNASMQSGKSFQLVDRFPGDFDNFLRKSLKRVFDKVGCSLFKKLFGCAIAASAPLPVSFVSYILQREKLSIPKQHVLDALSLFMVFSETFAFLHNLIPAWLTDEDKAQELYIDRNIEANYLKDVILEILLGFIREQSQDVPLMKPDLLDYVLRVGIRFLSGFAEKYSLETVFSCLTSFKYIETRIQSRRIEISSLIEDYKLAANCQFDDEGRKEIIFGVCSALERNIFVLLECPYLLHSCLQSASEVVQDNVVIPDGESATRLQLNAMPLLCKRLQNRSNFAVSPDGKLFAERHWTHISLFDSYSLKCVGLFFSGDFVSGSKCLEFSPDGKFLFLGRLDRWFSLEDESVEKFPQFSRIDSNYEWGSFTLDKQCIVVKRCNFSFKPNDSCCWLCLLNNLCLWAAEEIGQSHEADESESICGCFPCRLRVQIRSSAVDDQDSPVPAMRILLNILRQRHHKEWCSLLEKLQLSYPFKAVCRYCPSRMRRETPTLTVVRDFVLSHYNEIFKYQVWDVQTGKSALEQAFSSGVQLSPFTYVCHLGTALEKCGVLFSDVDKSLSLCNIALLNTVCHHLFFFECYRQTFIWKEFGVFEEFSIINSLTELNSVFKEFEETEVESQEKRCKLFSELERVNRIKQINTRLERLTVLERSDSQAEELVVRLEKLERREELEREELEQMQVVEQIKEQHQQQRKVLEQREVPEHLLQLKLLEQLERCTQLERLGQRGQIEEIKKFQEFVSSRYFKEDGKQYKLLDLDKLVEEEKLLELHKLLDMGKLFELAWKRLLGQGEQREREDPFEAYKLLLTPCEHLHQSWLKRFSQFEQLVNLFWYHLESNVKFKFLEAFHFGIKVFTNALPDAKEKALFTSILPCVSPDGKWIAIRQEGDETTVELYQGQHQHQHGRSPEHVIKEVEHFAFANNGVFFLYLTVQRSLHTLSLVSGTILTSVSDVRPLSSTSEKHSGYRFQDDDEETIIFVKDLPPAFLSSFFPVVKAAPIQVAFASAEAILVLYSDSTLVLMESGGTAIASETSLEHPFGRAQHVKKGQFSPDGKVIVTHQGTKILLYDTVPGSNEACTDHGKCPDSVFETKDDFNVLHLTFSGDSTLLHFGIQRNIGLSFFVWNVQEKVLSPSFDSPGLMYEDCCCCFSLDSKELIICTKFCIDFWDHSSHPCRLLRTVGTGLPNTKVNKLTHCSVSPNNDMLAYCITDRIFLCPLITSTDHSMIRQLPRAHLGKVEFCQFLGGNRYLISYGIDGNVFLWDLSEWKVASFANIVQGRESIVSMAVSAERDKVVCVTSSGRLNVIKPCGLKDAMLSRFPFPKGVGSEKMAETSHGQVREPTAAIQNLRYSDNTEDLDAAELRIEEMEFMSSSDEDEDSDELVD